MATNGWEEAVAAAVAAQRQLIAAENSTVEARRQRDGAVAHAYWGLAPQDVIAAAIGIDQSQISRIISAVAADHRRLSWTFDGADRLPLTPQQKVEARELGWSTDDVTNALNTGWEWHDLQQLAATRLSKVQGPGGTLLGQLAYGPPVVTLAEKLEHTSWTPVGVYRMAVAVGDPAAIRAGRIPLPASVLEEVAAVAVAIDRHDGAPAQVAELIPEERGGLDPRHLLTGLDAGRVTTRSLRHLRTRLSGMPLDELRELRGPITAWLQGDGPRPRIHSHPESGTRRTNNKKG